MDDRACWDVINSNPCIVLIFMMLVLLADVRASGAADPDLSNSVLPFAATAAVNLQNFSSYVPQQ